MKQFLLQLIVFFPALMLSMLVVFFLADGRSDPYYLRFTTPRQSSLIIGSSRAAQGLQPAVLDQLIYKNGDGHFYNYAFSLLESPFGPAYYKSIKQKLDPATRDGIFIIAVDPWSISSADENEFAEDKTFMGKTSQVNTYPNFCYLLRSYNEPYIDILRKRKADPVMRLHDDGWLEVNTSLDSNSMKKNADEKLGYYRRHYLPVYRFSEVRLHYLSKTIDLLQKHGTVYLVRLPVAEAMFQIEDSIMPAFDDRMNRLATVKQIGYLNFRNLQNDYQYVDGHHLYQSSGKRVSALIAGWVLKSR